MTDYKNNSTTPRASKHTSRPYHYDYTSSIDEAEESDCYLSKRSRRLSENGHRKNIGSAFSLYVPNRKIEAKDEENIGLASRRRYVRKWETDDELFKPNHRNSMPIITQQQQHPPVNNHNNHPDEATTTRSLLHLLNKERTNRREIQKSYDTTAQALKELQQNHQVDINTFESDIKTLQDALVKESQSNKFLREEMQMWANKFALVEEQGKELQKAFQETIEQLEKGEEEVMRLRKENQTLHNQLAGRAIEPANLGRRNLEDVRKVGSMEDRDDLSVSAESKQECISDNESVATYSKLTELNDRIIELENELIASKENTQKVESSFQELETEKTSAIKQLEEKHKKTVSLLRATISHEQRKIKELEQELRKAKFNEREREEKEKLSHVKPKSPQQFPSPPSPKLQHHQPIQQDDDDELDQSMKDRIHHRTGQIKRRSNILEGLTTKDRKNSVTSTNSGSIEGISVTGGSIEDKDDMQNSIIEYREGEGEMFSEEEEEERDDQSSSVFTGSENWVQSRNGSEETASVQDPTFVRSELSLGRQQHHQLRKGGDDDVAVEDDDDMLDAILSEREDRSLPLIGHYSAAEYTEDEDFDRDYRLSRRQSFVGKIGGNKIEGASINQMISGGRS